MWGPGVRPSQFILLKGTPSRRPRARGAGLPEGHGRARTANPHPPQYGARVLSRSARAVAAPDRGGPAGAKGARTVTAWGTRGRVMGAVWLRWATQAVPGGHRVWRLPSGAAVSRAPLEESPRGARGATPREATGRVRRAVWLGWATQAVPGGGAPGMVPPPGRLSHAPCWRRHPGGAARSDAAGGDGAFLQVHRVP